MPDRTIIIGDVHGCVRELDLLIHETGHETGDNWIFVGDLVAKGEASREVLDRVIDMRARSVVGNHERNWLEFHRSGAPSRLRRRDLDAALGLEAKHWTCLENMERWIELREFGVLVVHGGFLPSIPWREQDARLVTTIQVVDASGRARMRRDCPDGTPWADLWNGPEFVAYGHTPRREVSQHPHAIGLDTGCVHGGMLTAWVLPERKLVQIPALRAYRSGRL